MNQLLWGRPIKRMLTVAFFTTALGIILGVGVHSTLLRRVELDSFLRHVILSQATSIAGAVNQESARRLSFTEEDAGTQAFIHIQEQLDSYASLLRYCHIYTVGVHDGELAYGPSANTSNLFKAPGYAYASEHHRLLFEAARPFAYGPYTELMLAGAPVVDTETNEVVMAVILEWAVDPWISGLYAPWREPIFPCALMVILLIIGAGLITLRNRAQSFQGIQGLYHLETIFAAMFCVSVVAAIAFYTMENENMQRYYKWDSIVAAKTARINMAEQTIQHNLITLAATAPSSDPDAFREKATPLVRRASIRSCYHVVSLPGNQRASFENYLWQNGSDGLEIHRWDEYGEMVGMAPAESYYPVKYGVARGNPLFAPGFDMASLPGQLETIRAALDENKIMSAPLRPHHVNNTVTTGRRLVYAPDTAGQPPSHTLAAVELCLPTLLYDALTGGDEDAGFSGVHMFKMSPDTSYELTASFPQNTFITRAGAPPNAGLISEDLAMPRPAQLFGNNWTLEIYPQRSFYQRYPLQRTQATLMIGIWLVIAFTLGIGTLRRQQVSLEKRVWLHTAELAEREETFRRLFADSEDPMLLLRRGVFVDCNKAALRALQYDARQMLLQRRPEEISPKHQFDGRLSADVVRDMITRCIRHGHQMFEYNHLRRDGSLLPVEIMLTLISIRGVNHIHVTWRDITERKRAEEAPRIEEEKYRSLVDSLPIGLYRTMPDEHGGFIMVNNALARAQGSDTPDAITTLAFKDLFVYPEDYQAIYDELLARGYVSGKEVLLKRLDETTIWVSITARAVHGQDGNIECFDGSVMDITERKRAAEQRMEMERRLLHTQKLESLGILAGGIAHDFNNLLLAVLGNLELVLEESSETSPTHANIERSVTAARRAAMLTNQMLAYSGKGQFVVQAVDLTRLVNENIQMLRASVFKTITMNLRLDERLPMIQADEGQIQQVVMNLITNASEAIGETSGIVTISTGEMLCDATYLQQSHILEKPEPGRFVWLEVSDTGCGIDGATLKKIFDPFFTTKFTGRGLGMSAILGIIKGHHGALIINSTVAQGSTIRVLFPAYYASVDLTSDHEVPVALEIREVPPIQEMFEDPFPDERAAEKQTPVEQPSQAGTVLVVDDEEALRELGANILSRCGYQTVTANDGQEAVEIFKEQADDIVAVLLDLTMPRMDGLAAFKIMQEIKPGVKVILCSGFSEQEAVERFSGHSLAGFVHKPYRIATLRATIEQALGPVPVQPD